MVSGGDLRVSHYLCQQGRQALSKSSHHPDSQNQDTKKTLVGFWVRQTGAWVLVLQFTTFMTLGKLVYLPEPSFPQL